VCPFSLKVIDAELLKISLLKIICLFQDEKYLEDADIDDLFKKFLNTVYLIEMKRIHHA
jgi:hypothetical protein